MKRNTDHTGENWRDWQSEPPVDPHLDALLDEALAADAVPGGMPADLSQRILARTRPMLRPAQRSVLARLGPAWTTALAASLLLAATVGVIVLTAPTGQRETGTLAAVRRDLDALRRYNGPRDGLDEEMALLATHIDLARSRETWSGDLGGVSLVDLDDDRTEEPSDL